MDDTLWTALVAAARAYAAHFFGDEATSITIGLRHLGQAGPWPMPFNGMGQPATAAVLAVPVPPVNEGATDVEQAILDVLRRAERPLKASAIATRAGRRPTSYFRSCITRMRAAGVVIHVEGGGWWLAGRELPRE